MDTSKKEKQDYGRVAILFLALCNAIFSPFLYLLIPTAFGVFWMLLYLLSGLKTDIHSTFGPPLSQYLCLILSIVYLLLSAIFLITSYIKCLKSLNTYKLKIAITLLMLLIISIAVFKLGPGYKSALGKMSLILK